MEHKPDRKEMIRMAVETRKQVTSAVVTREEMEEYPAKVEKILVPTREGDSEVYITAGEGVEGITPLVINFHGGGFIKKRTENDELFCRKLSCKLECRVMDVDYRVAPEYPFPCGLYECHDVTVWAAEHAEALSADPDKIILCGHSAGGNFVVGISMMLEEEGKCKPLGIVSGYPPLDLTTDPALKPQRGGGIPAERARLYNLYYCEESQQRNPLASPLLAGEEQLKNFPKALFITAGEDSLCTEAEEFALKAARAGNEITLKRFKGAAHGFTIYRMEGYEAATDLIIRFMEALLAEN